MGKSRVQYWKCKCCGKLNDTSLHDHCWGCGADPEGISPEEVDADSDATAQSGDRGALQGEKKGANAFLHFLSVIYILVCTIAAILIWSELGTAEVHGYRSGASALAVVAGIAVLVQGFAVGVFFWVVGNIAHDLSIVKKRLREGMKGTQEPDAGS